MNDELSYVPGQFRIEDKVLAEKMAYSQPQKPTAAAGETNLSGQGVYHAELAGNRGMRRA